MNISHQSSSTKQSEDSCVKEIRGLSRREFIALASASALVATAGCRGEKSMTERKEASTNELVELSAVDVVAKLRNGEITAERYAAAILEQCQRGKTLNAFSSRYRRNECWRRREPLTVSVVQEQGWVGCTDCRFR
jgi:hypothetical protein